MVTAGEHCDFAAACSRSGYTEGGHDGLRSRITECNAFHSSQFADQRGCLSSERGLETKADAPSKLLLYRLNHERGTMAKQQRAKAHGQINVLVSVDIPDRRTFSPVQDKWVAQFFPRSPEPSDSSTVS